VNANGYITASEAREALKAVYREDPESNLQKALLNALADDLKPLNEKGRWRPSSLLVLAGLLLVAFLGIFFCLSFGVSR
jgi:hypothetical protein